MNELIEKNIVYFFISLILQQDYTNNKTIIEIRILYCLIIIFEADLNAVKQKILTHVIESEFIDYLSNSSVSQNKMIKDFSNELYDLISSYDSVENNNKI